MRARNIAIGLFAIAAACLVAISAIAQVSPPPASTTTINFAGVIHDFLQGILPAVIIVISAFGAWIGAAIKRKTSLDIEFLHRDALEKFLDNQAGRFLAPIDSLQGLTIDIKNEGIAKLAQEALNRIPDAIRFFGLNWEQIAQRIIDKIGIQTASAIPAAVPSEAEKAKA